MKLSPTILRGVSTGQGYKNRDFDTLVVKIGEGEAEIEGSEEEE